MEILALTLGGALLTIILEMIQDRINAAPDRDPKEIVAELLKEVKANTAARGPEEAADIKSVLDILAAQKPE